MGLIKKKKPSETAKPEVKEEPKPEPTVNRKAGHKGVHKYDYKFVIIPGSAPVDEKEERLDALGAEGWEIVGFNGEQYIFQRLLA